MTSVFLDECCHGSRRTWIRLAWLWGRERTEQKKGLCSCFVLFCISLLSLYFARLASFSVFCPFPRFEEGVMTTSKRIFRMQWITGFTVTPDLAFVFLHQTHHPFQFITMAFDHINTHSTVQQHVITICRHYENMRAIVGSKNYEE